MAISLAKGQHAPLADSPTQFYVGLGWDPQKGPGEDFDLDASCLMLDDDEKLRSNRDLIFYNQRSSACGTVILSDDNRDGQGDGDDEFFQINLALLPPDVKKLLFVVTIHQANERKQNFGQVDSAFIRVANSVEELARFDLTRDACLEKSLIFGELYQKNGEWRFRALGDGFNGDLQALAKHYCR